MDGRTASFPRFLKMADPPVYFGALEPSSTTSDFNAHSFLIRQIIETVPGAAVVQVTAVTGGGVAPVGFVSVHPLVNQIDNFGKPTPHGTVHNLPFFRVQGGASAIICDPKVGDIGLAIFANRDTSSVKATRKQANPGTRRKNSWSDGFYLGGYLNAAPTSYVEFVDGKINIIAPGLITIASTSEIQVVSLGPVSVTAPTMTHNGVNVGATHVHSDPQGGNTGPPH